MFFVAPICVPPLGQRPPVRSAGPQRKNVNVPLQVAVPATTSCAESLTETDPPSIDRPPAAMALPEPSLGVVVNPAVQLPKPPRMKSFRTAEVEVDERVS